MSSDHAVTVQPPPPASSPFSWPDAPPPVAVSEAAGPMPLANWCIPRVLCVGGYPSAMEVTKARQYAESVAACRFTHIINLMQTRELSRFRQYAGLVQHCASKLDPPSSSSSATDGDTGVQIEFLNFQIPDGGLPKDEEEFLAFVATLVQILKGGGRIYMHCWGGHGRTGTVLCVLLAAIYPTLSGQGCLDLCQALHQAREYNGNHKSPEEHAQKNFVLKMIDRMRTLQQKGSEYSLPQGFNVPKLPFAPYVEPSSAAAASAVTAGTGDPSHASTARARAAARAAGIPTTPPRAGGGSGVIVVDSYGTASTTQALSAVPSTPLQSPAQRRLSADTLELGGAACRLQLLVRQMLSVEDSCASSNDMMIDTAPNSASDSSSSSASSTVAIARCPPPFTLLTFNTLADALSTPGAFPHTDASVLEWGSRRNMLLDEMTGVGRTNGDGTPSEPPAIVCLQEVDHFADWFAPQLAARGYSQSFFMQKARGGDGVAVFVRDSAFRVRRAQKVRFPDMNQVALLLQLEPVDNARNASSAASSNASSSPSSTPPLRRMLYVATTHLKAKDGFELIRLRQVHLLTQYLQRFISVFHDAPLPAGASTPLDVSSEIGANPPHASLAFALPPGAAVIIAGDCNDTPDSCMYRFLAEGACVPPADLPQRRETLPSPISMVDAIMAHAPHRNWHAYAQSPTTTTATTSSCSGGDPSSPFSPATPPPPVTTLVATSSAPTNSPTATSSAAAAPCSPITHALWLHSLYNRMWRPDLAPSSINHPGSLYTTAKRRAVRVQRCIDYVFFSPHTLTPTALLSIPNQTQSLPTLLPAETYPSDHLAIAGTFAWKA